MKVSCHCIANIDGHCVAESCRGEITALDVNISSQEQAKRLYDAAASMFEGEFS